MHYMYMIYITIDLKARRKVVSRKRAAARNVHPPKARPHHQRIADPALIWGAAAVGLPKIVGEVVSTSEVPMLEDPQVTPGEDLSCGVPRRQPNEQQLLVAAVCQIEMGGGPASVGGQLQ